MMHLIMGGLRAIFGLLDRVVVWLIQNLYVLLVQIANTNVFGNFIYEMLGRIYVFLGVFMLFKLSMSMVTYIINPDAMTDKNKGFSKLIINVVLSLILLVTTPTIFKEAYRLQAIILNNNAIYQIVTGRKASSSDDSALALEEAAADLGDDIAKGIYQPFIYEYQADASVKGSVNMPVTDSGRCEDAACMVAHDTVTKEGDGPDGFANEYKILLSTVCGAVVAYFFLVFCLDAAVRAIKLGVLQIIAPIPILSMIDPKGGMDKIKKWASTCGKEYAGLFIRLAGVFFATEIIRLIMDPEFGLHYYNTDGTTGARVESVFVQLFIIIGCLMFAKQLPQFIEQVLGVKLSGDGFNLKKRLSSMPGMGAAKVLGAGALGFAGGMAANTLAARKNFGWDKNKGFWKNIGSNALGGLKGVGSMAAGGISGMGRGAFSKEKSMWKAGSAGIKGAVDKRNLRDQRQATGYHIGRRMIAGVNAFSGVDNLAGFDSQIKQYSDIEKGASSILSRANSEMIKYENLAFKDNAGNNVTMKDFKVAKEYLSSLRATDTSQMSSSQLQAHVSEINRLQGSIAKTEKLAEQAYVDSVIAGDIKDVQTSSLIEGLNNIIRTSTDDTAKSQSVETGASIKAAKDAMADAKASVENSVKYQRAQANKKQK